MKSAQWLSRNVKIDKIYHSDLTRAKQTAQILSELSDAPMHEDARLRPWNIGDLSGQEITPERLKLSDELQRKYPDTPAPNGESYNAFEQRFAGALHDILPEATKHNIVIVAHHRNALALHHMLYGKPVVTKGPPDPGGIVLATKHNLYPVYTPPEEVEVSKKSTS
jgi:broad specificity phosphatase PhoE